MSSYHLKNEKCPICKKEYLTIVRLASDGNLQTLTSARICANPECTMKIDINKVEGWVPK